MVVRHVYLRLIVVVNRESKTINNSDHANSRAITVFSDKHYYLNIFHAFGYQLQDLVSPATEAHCCGRLRQLAAMADLEAVLADVSYLMAMEKSKMTPAARASKKIILPDARCVSSMHRDLL